MRYPHQGLQLPYICIELNWLSKPSCVGHTVQNDQKCFSSLSCLPHDYLLDLVIVTIPRSQLIFGQVVAKPIHYRSNTGSSPEPLELAFQPSFVQRNSKETGSSVFFEKVPPDTTQRLTFMDWLSPPLFLIQFRMVQQKEKERTWLSVLGLNQRPFD